MSSNSNPKSEIRFLQLDELVQILECIFRYQSLKVVAGKAECLDKAITAHCRKWKGTTTTKPIAPQVHVCETREVRNFSREIIVVKIPAKRSIKSNIFEQAVRFTSAKLFSLK